MKSTSRFRPAWLAGIVRTFAVGCALCFGTLTAAHAEKDFNTPDAAMNAFGEAVTNNDEATLQSIFGRDFRDLIPPVGADIRSRFLDEWGKAHQVEQTGDNHARITVGNDGWTFPVPLVKGAKGWHFDMQAGAEEMRLRRIGRNELAVIQTMLAIYDAQREYALTDHDGVGLLRYASKLSSSPGKHDGLYWPTEPDAPPSPLGPAFVQAATPHAADAGYHGYHYKLLTSQGPHAPGGAYDYVAHGKLFGGFAVLAWPVRYGDTGIKSFMVSHAGQVYERDLGPDSAAKAKAISSFDPGPGWAKVQP
ncbi:DUF2950 domain-containing protein [Paraburkholderia caribensis]|uniref:DUF2950 domain-containing protein n=1 Tax=Paraburkholderia caribensis TaxID=75105 RepID=A0A9Q6S4F6_9BURK|nr:DUF2950 domain-containing protein [Paraburkholderia caribensis]MCO4877253.1 DUF2950 domain-containing protein [Paraburkholderia caribensis]PTB28960.1 DUF2950 domain-containing protein [Paraburkholderia caribensis]QLB64400.1 hypothetical protein A9O66_18085 [Paraburkholderia caribensis]